MYLSKNLNVNEFGTLYEWVEAVSEETGVEEQTIWGISEKLLLDPDMGDQMETEVQLLILISHHLSRWDRGNENPPGTWIDFTVKIGDEVVDGLQFSHGMFNVPVGGDEERIESMKALTRDEGLEVSVNDPEVIATDWRRCETVWVMQMLDRILNEVFDGSLNDVVSAEEEVSLGVNRTWDDLVELR